MDVQGVSLYTASSMDRKAVSLSTVSGMDVQGVSQTIACSVDVQGVCIPFHLCKVFFKCQCAAGFALLNLPKGKSLGRSKPATSSYAQALATHCVGFLLYPIGCSDFDFFSHFEA
jgi:hypothetical protein